MTPNLNDGFFKPYHKLDDIIQCIKQESNRSPNLIKHLPVAIEKRLSNLSPVEKIFKESVIYYGDTLSKADYINKLDYHTPSASNHKNKNDNGTLYGLTHHTVKTNNENRPIFLINNRYSFPKKPHLQQDIQQK